MAAATVLGVASVTSSPISTSFQNSTQRKRISLNNSQSNSKSPLLSLRKGASFVFACLPPPPPPPPPASQSPTASSLGKPSSSPSTKIYVSGLSFRTTEESLRNAFQNFGQLVEVNLVMDKIANRPRGFAFLRYATEEDSQKAIKGMHGKFLHGRVIFVEVAKPRSELRQRREQNPR